MDLGDRTTVICHFPWCSVQCMTGSPSNVVIFPPQWGFGPTALERGIASRAFRFKGVGEGVGGYKGVGEGVGGY